MVAGEAQGCVEELVLDVLRAKHRVDVWGEILGDSISPGVHIRALGPVVAGRPRVAGLDDAHRHHHVVIGERQDGRGPCTCQDAPHAARFQAGADHRVFDLLAGRVALLLAAEHAVAGVAGNRLAIRFRIGRHVGLVVNGDVARIRRGDHGIDVDLRNRRTVARF